MITLVTAFFDIGRSKWSGYINGHPLPGYLKRSNEEYFSNFTRLLKLENPIVLFTSIDLMEECICRFSEYRNLTILPIEDWTLIQPHIRAKVKIIHENPKFQRFVRQPWNPEYWNTDYIMVNFLKTHFVNHAIDFGYVDTPMVAWIDFGYARKDDDVPSSRWIYDFDPEKIHLFQNQTIPPEINLVDVIKNNTVYIQGCHIVAHKKLWIQFYPTMIRQMNMLLNNNLVDDDQTLLLMSYLESSTDFELHAGDQNDWFQIFRNFNNV